MGISWSYDREIRGIHWEYVYVCIYIANNIILRCVYKSRGSNAEIFGSRVATYVPNSHNLGND